MAIVKATYTKSRGGAKASIRYIEHRPGKDGDKITRNLFTQSLQVRPVGALFVLHFQWITALEERSWNLLGSIST